jgi:hypothetical protein
MPLPTPRSGEKQKDFVQRCMSDDTMAKEFPNKDQRFAVCVTQWKER